MKRADKPLIGIVMSIAETDAEVSSRREAVLQGLGRTNLRLTFRFGRKTPKDDVINYDELADELIRRKPDVIFSSCWPTMNALAKQTKDIPIVYAGLFNMDGRNRGYRFGDNVTGFVSHEFDVCKLWPLVLSELAPRVEQMAVIYEGVSSGGTSQFEAVQSSVKNVVKEIDLSEKNSPSLLEDAIAKFKKQEPAGGVIVTTGALTATLGETIIGLAAKYKLPAIYPNRLNSVRGGLISCGADLLDLYRGAGRYLGKILDGARPSELATQINKHFEIVINLNTAARLGLKVSPALRDRASLLIGD